jgi:hypothetical protein
MGDLFFYSHYQILHQRLISAAGVLDFPIVDFINLQMKLQVYASIVWLQSIELCDQVIQLSFSICEFKLGARCLRTLRGVLISYLGHEHIYDVGSFIEIYSPDPLVKVVFDLHDLVAGVVLVVEVFKECLRFLFRVVIAFTRAGI